MGQRIKKKSLKRKKQKNKLNIAKTPCSRRGVFVLVAQGLALNESHSGSNSPKKTFYSLLLQFEKGNWIPY